MRDFESTCVDEYESLRGVRGIRDNPCTTSLSHVKSCVCLCQAGISLSVTKDEFHLIGAYMPHTRTIMLVSTTGLHTHLCQSHEQELSR